MTKILKVDIMNRTVTELVGGEIIKRDATMKEVRAELDRRKTYKPISDVLEYPSEEIAMIKQRDYTPRTGFKIDVCEVLKSIAWFTLGLVATWVFVVVYMIVL